VINQLQFTHYLGIRLELVSDDVIDREVDFDIAFPSLGHNGRHLYHTRTRDTPQRPGTDY